MPPAEGGGMEINMSIIYLTEHGTELGISNGRFEIKKDEKILCSIPSKTVEGITMLSKSQITTQCVEFCLINGIDIIYMSVGGTVYGKITSCNHSNAKRQRKQIEVCKETFCVALAKKTLAAKIYNQYIVLRRYEKSKNIKKSLESKMLFICYKKIKTAKTLNKIMGYEGSAAKYYFQGLSNCIDKQFVFKGRSRRPARDEFNMLLNIGYHLLLGIIINCIEHKGLNPYAGYVHSDSKGHPALASDMIEEWRAIIVDSTVMSLINRRELTKNHFEYDATGKVNTLTKEGFVIFLNKIENKLKSQNKYLSYINRSIEFREAIWLQVNRLSKAIENENVDYYKAVCIR